MASPDLQWLIIRNNSSFLLKGNGQTYSREQNNLKSKNSFRYNGLVNRQTVGVVPAKDGKGVVLVTKKSKAGKRPGSSYNKVELKRGSRQTFSTIRKTLRNNSYRKDLKMVRLWNNVLKVQNNFSWFIACTLWVDVTFHMKFFETYEVKQWNVIYWNHARKSAHVWYTIQ